MYLNGKSVFRGRGEGWEGDWVKWGKGDEWEDWTMGLGGRGVVGGRM